jgi:hypothetical protein
MAFTEINDNTASRRRLEELANRLTDEDLALTTDYGWTAAALFAHMAWWDQRVMVLLRRWKEGGVDEAPVDSHMINEALKPLCHALDPRKAVALCLASAEETDAEVASTSGELIAEIEASPNFFRLNRSLHRNGHIDDIESMLVR